MNILTKKEKIILKTLKEFYSKEGKMPSMRGLQDEVKKHGLELKSVGSVFIYLRSLKEKGYIKKNNQGKVELINQSAQSFVNVPVMGTASAGAPAFFAEENIDGFLKISNKIAKSEFFAIQIEGDSMNLARVKGRVINQGDFVIINPDQKNFKNDDKVLAVIDGLATIKTFKKIDQDKIGLFPESSNPRHKPIYLTSEDEFVINGKVIDVLKSR
ncbi:LexA family protein [Patescibacteria group bacterium]